MEYSKCWLNYRKIATKDEYRILSHLEVCVSGVIIDSAILEYRKAIKEMLGITVTVCSKAETEGLQGHVVLEICEDERISKDGYGIQYRDHSVHIFATTHCGVLYGVFELIRQLQKESSMKELSLVKNPDMPLRMINHWDNMDGSIERGYSGESFFFKDYKILYNDRIEFYGRMMASIGMNAIVINNVNVHQRESYLITDEYLEKVKAYADLFGRYGIKLYLCVNFAAPMEISDFELSDPLDESVIHWWEKATAHVYESIPDFGGFLVKADSEGRPGPFTYGRTQADGANMLARTLAPFGGTLIWRCFVYNCGQDWRDKKTDRAKASYDYFMDLDGQFEENVILQIKNGPMDFQVREPVSPLFGGLKKTNAMLEVQAAQEYTGQQKHVCYLIPMWKEILSFDTYGNGEGTTVEQVVSGKAYGNSSCGIATVTNTGNDFNWTGHDLSAANLYGFGRLAFDTSLTSEEIAREWVQLTLSNDKKVVETVVELLMNSWPTYEKYTSPLGIGWMVTPHFHYGPDVDGYEYDRWGTYHRADRNGLGVDRTIKGTGFTSQYNEPQSSLYENIETCPEELLLFFHYIRYDYVLKTKKTLIQHIYDTHFEGYDEVEHMIAQWDSLKENIDADVFQRVSQRLVIQKESAKEWRDRINTYFFRKSGVPDEKGRTIYQ